MKFRVLLSLILIVFLFLSGCTNKESDISLKEESNAVVYFGREKSGSLPFLRNHYALS